VLPKKPLFIHHPTVDRVASAASIATIIIMTNLDVSTLTAYGSVNTNEHLATTLPAPVEHLSRKFWNKEYLVLADAHLIHNPSTTSLFFADWDGRMEKNVG
jgi:hypothetical protein